jgi:hypothetical protein
VFSALGAAIRTMTADYDEAELRTIERYLGDTTRVLRAQMILLKAEKRADRVTVPKGPPP